MDELREKIAKLHYEFEAPIQYFNWDKVQEKDRPYYLREADAVIKLFKSAGYIKPQGEPPLLSDEEIRVLMTCFINESIRRYGKSNPEAPLFLKLIRMLKYYEGIK